MLDMQFTVAGSAEACSGMDIHPHQRPGNAAPSSPTFHQAHEEIRILGDAEARIEPAHLAQAISPQGNPAASGQAVHKAPRIRPAAPIQALLAAIALPKDYARP